MSRKSATVGQYIRHRVIPAGMSVKDAAARLGVGRPALSNLLNGKASLSPKMATRLQRAFGADREELLQLQGVEDRERIREDEKAVAVRGYVPNFLAIKARDIEQWADSIDARSHLSVLLRKLVHATGRDLARIDFPGFDDSQRPGWDGWVEADTATAWIPQGASGWEFGTSQCPHRKAESDYEKRLQLPMAEREQCAFVFVTPRRWPGKDDWAKAKKAEGDGWREVRAYDASDLEQWLEESVAVPVWLAEKLPMPIPGIKTLDKCWQEWAQATNPAMTQHLFQSSVDTCVDSFKEWLGKSPQQPFVVAADSKDEALAFLHCLFRHEDVADKSGDRAAAFTSTDTLAALATSSAPFIAIAANKETQHGLAVLHQRMHCIAICPRNATNVKPDFALALLGAAAFHEGLAGMGFGRHDFDRLTRESGRSPTVLRRRLATIPVTRTPRWASDKSLASLLTPLCLLGAWHVDSKADRKVVATLANCDHEDVEKHIAQLLQVEDSPVWSVGSHRGVTSKIDALFAIAPKITKTDLRRFFEVARDVLLEVDPRLELPETERWAAVIRGKVRAHSGALRNGVLETLVLLSVHGNYLFLDQLGIDVKAMVTDLVDQLLTPLACRLQSQERDLPTYAEAAPDRFLSILEDDLNSSEPAVLRLLKPVRAGPFEHCPRTGLLWAIECVAWNPEHLSRACLLLASLSQVEIVDNLINKPIESLAAILRSWMPQTAASLEERIRILKMLARRFPEVAWQLCLGEIARYRIGMDNYRPRWRSDAEGAGGVSSTQDTYNFIQCAVSLLLSRPEHDQTSLGDLVENIEALPETRQLEVWNLIDAWADRADERAVADLREVIRRCTLTRVGRARNGSTIERARFTYERLEPKTPIARHGWLFADQWVEETEDEIEESRIDLEARERRVDASRQAAMADIWADGGLDDVLTMIGNGDDPRTLGHYAASCLTDTADVLRTCLASELDKSRIDAFIGEIIFQRANPDQCDLLFDICKQVDGEQSVRLCVCAPFQEATWRMLDRLSAEVRDQYWRTVSPSNRRLAGVECTEIVNRLLAVARPWTAFLAVMFQWESVETSSLARLLKEAASGGELENFSSVHSWRLSEALDVLGARPGITDQDMARLEFAFVEALSGSEHGIPNLEWLIDTSPAFFVDILSFCFKRDDGRQEPLRLQVADETRRRMVTAGYQILQEMARIPGTKDDGSVDSGRLLSWIEEVRGLCIAAGRAAIGDLQIGELLSRAPEEDDAPWPCNAICEALEAIATNNVADGFIFGKCNMRGVFIRTGCGGEMERELSVKYRRLAQHRRVDYPFTGSVLKRLAECYDKDAKREDRRELLSKRLDTWD